MTGPSRAALAALVALGVVGGAFILGLYALTSPADRPGMLAGLAPALAGFVAGVPAFLAWLSGRQLNAQHRETSEAVARVEEQTNGQLTARIAVANALLREELLAALLPTQRTELPAAVADAQAAGLPTGLPPLGS